MLCVNIWAAICLIWVTSAYGAFEDVELGARPLAMGSAFAAAADDANAIFWNPGGLTQIEHRELTMSYMELYDLVSYSSLGYAQNMKIGTAGIGFVSSSDIDGVYQEMIIALSAAKEIYKDLSLGINTKYLYSAANIDDIKLGSGKGLSLDTGLQYNIHSNLLRLGVVLQNLMGYVSYTRKEIKNIPGKRYWEKAGFLYKAGASVDLGHIFPEINKTFVIAELSDGDIHAGTEYVFRDVLAVRAGFRTGNALARSITIGFGLKLPVVTLDYAYVGSQVGTQTSQISVSIVW